MLVKLQALERFRSASLGYLSVQYQVLEDLDWDYELVLDRSLTVLELAFSL